MRKTGWDWASLQSELQRQLLALLGRLDSDERKKVEMRFAHLKTHHRFERMRLRGLSGARDEFHLAAIVQNLKTLVNYVWRPPLNMPAACVT
jgi:Transposase DDE domain